MVQSVFQTIQILRGIAATLVAGFHLMLGVRSEGYDWYVGELLFAGGTMGVDIFFVISGFIIYYTSFKAAKPTPRAFLINRFWRVMPPYWVATIASILLGLGAFLILNDNSHLFSVPKILSSMALWPMAPDDYVLLVSWTLSLEVMFYILFAVTALRFNATLFFVSLLVWYFISLALSFYAEDTSGWAYPSMNPIVFEFFLGALIAKLHLSGLKAYHRTALLIGSVSLLTILLNDISATSSLRREFLYGLPSAAIIYGAIGVNWNWPKPMLVWGESSYLLYLVHMMIFQVVGVLVKQGTSFSLYSTWWSATGLLAFTVVLSMFLSLVLERRYQAYYKRFIIR